MKQYTAQFDYSKNQVAYVMQVQYIDHTFSSDELKLWVFTTGNNSYDKSWSKKWQQFGDETSLVVSHAFTDSALGGSTFKVRVAKKPKAPGSVFFTAVMDGKKLVMRKNNNARPPQPRYNNNNNNANNILQKQNNALMVQQNFLQQQRNMLDAYKIGQQWAGIFNNY